MNWQMQLFLNYSGHFFIARKHRMYDADSENALYDANMCILELKLDQTEMKTNISELQKRIQALELENSSLLAQIKASEKGKAVDRSSVTHSRGGTKRSLQNSTTRAVDHYSHSSSSVNAPSVDPSSNSYAAAARRAKNTANSNKGPVVRNLSKQADFQRDTGPSSSSNSHVVSLAAAGPSRNDSHSPKSELLSASADEASLLLALQMQADFSNEDSNLRTQLHDLQSSQSTFQCGICIDDNPMDDIYVLHSGDKLGHNFCRTCLREHITVQLQEHRFPIFCPMCVAGRSVEPMCMCYFGCSSL